MTCQNRPTCSTCEREGEDKKAKPTKKAKTKNTKAEASAYWGDETPGGGAIAMNFCPVVRLTDIINCAKI